MTVTSVIAYRRKGTKKQKAGVYIFVIAEIKSYPSFTSFFVLPSKNVCLLVSLSPKEKKRQKHETLCLILGLTEHPALTSASSLTPSPLRWSITSDLKNTLSMVLDQAYLITASPLDDIMHVVGTSLLRKLAFGLILYSSPTFIYL